MRSARNVANRVHVFADGYDVETGAAEAVFGNPQHETTKAFLHQAGNR